MEDMRRSRAKSRRLILAVAALSLCQGLFSCGGGEEENGQDYGRILYEGTIKLADIYTDSLRLAPDSAATEDAFRHFMAQLDTLNFRLPPETDLQLHEGENDTIFMRLIEMRRLYDKKLRELARGERRDTTETQND